MKLKVEFFFHKHTHSLFIKLITYLRKENTLTEHLIVQMYTFWNYQETRMQSYLNLVIEIKLNSEANHENRVPAYQWHNEMPIHLFNINFLVKKNSIELNKNDF